MLGWAKLIEVLGGGCGGGGLGRSFGAAGFTSENFYPASPPVWRRASTCFVFSGQWAVGSGQ
jgi:hypothetical protein